MALRQCCCSAPPAAVATAVNVTVNVEEEEEEVEQEEQGAAAAAVPNERGGRRKQDNGNNHHTTRKDESPAETTTTAATVTTTATIPITAATTTTTTATTANTGADLVASVTATSPPDKTPETKAAAIAAVSSTAAAAVSSTAAAAATTEEQRIVVVVVEEQTTTTTNHPSIVPTVLSQQQQQQQSSSDDTLPSRQPPPPSRELLQPPPVPPANSKKRPRRSSRNTNSLKLPDHSSMHYRRLNQLFFQEEQESPSSGGEAEAEAAVRLIQIGKFVLQRVHASPNIYVIDNFLNASELAYLHDAIAKRKFQRSYVDRAAATAECGGSGDSGSGAEEDTAAGGVAGGSSHYDTTHRTSTFVSFEKQQDAKCAGIENKAAQLLGCWTSIMLEPLQLVRYLPGQFFDVHHDMGDFCPETGVVELPPKSLFSKRRVVTLFCYLNAVTSGGATHFPLATVGAAATATTDAAADHVDIANNDSLPSRSSSSEDGLRVEPVPGRAVLFSNVLSTGLPDPRTIHAGEPVLSGLKYGLNIWICEEK